MEVRAGYKQTEIGVIPEEWDVKKLNEVVHFSNGKGHEQFIDESGEYVVVNSKFISTEGNVRKYSRLNLSPLLKNDIALVMSDIPNGKALAKCYIIERDNTYTLNQRIGCIRPKNGDSKYYYYQLNRNEYFLSFDTGTGQTNLRRSEILDCPIFIPYNHTEQTAIATALSDADALISSLEKLIAKKRNIKQGAMQQLLQPKEGWEVKKLGEIADCLDYLRVPLNDVQRATMKGDIPYCGANGIVDYVNDFVVNDDIILMAEDGGYFDEYKTRPIAYRMTGKCWVNNHAHILKAKQDYDQGFLFYSLVHKNIMDYINGGTRAKLNKGELLNIQLSLPNDKAEQISVSGILNDMDIELTALEKKLEKYTKIKQGMMQQLLTGKIRLV